MRKYLAQLWQLVGGIITAAKKVNFIGGIQINGTDLSSTAAVLNDVVTKGDIQTITGAKTFSSIDTSFFETGQVVVDRENVN